MYSTQLIELLKVLNKKELRKLREYLKSDYLNPNKEVRKLFLFIKKYAPEYTSARLNKKNVWHYLFGGQQFDNGRLNKVSHRLKRLTEDFLIIYDLQQNDLQKERLLLQSLENRNHADYSKKSKKIIKVISQKPENSKSAKDYLNLFELNYALWSDVNTEKIGQDDLAFKESNTNLDTFYFLNKLKIILEYETSKGIIKNNFEMAHQAEIIALIQNHDAFRDSILVKLLLKALQMVKSNKLEDYLPLKQLLFDSIGALPTNEVRDIWVLMNNFNIRHLGQRPTFFAKEGYYLFCFAEENDFLLENGRIRDIEYINASVVGFFSNEKQWAFDFLRDIDIA